MTKPSDGFESDVQPRTANRVVDNIETSSVGMLRNVAVDVI